MIPKSGKTNSLISFGILSRCCRCSVVVVVVGGGGEFNVIPSTDASMFDSADIMTVEPRSFIGKAAGGGGGC